jgi:hypothetical protein
MINKQQSTISMAHDAQRMHLHVQLQHAAACSCRKIAHANSSA